MNQEQTKYLATFFNNLAVAIIIMGIITPIITNQKIEQKIITGIIISIVSGIILLWSGFYILQKVKK